MLQPTIRFCTLGMIFYLAAAHDTTFGSFEQSASCAEYRGSLPL